MDRKKVGCLLVVDPLNILYLTEFHGFESVHLLITKDKAYCVTDPRFEFDALSPEYEKIIIRKRTDKQRVRNTVSHIKNVHFFERSATYQKIRRWKSFLDKEMVPQTKDVILEMRTFKDEYELDAIKQAQHITESALLDQIRADDFLSMTERTIANNLHATYIKSYDAKLSFEPIVATGSNAASAHAQPTDKTVAGSNLVLIDSGATYNGYHGDMTRMIAIDTLNPEESNWIQAVEEALNAVEEKLEIGMHFKELHKTATQQLKHYGLDSFFTHSLGHGVGLEVHEEPMIFPKSTQSIKAGMAFTIEPGVYIPGKGGVRMENIYLVRENGTIDCANTLPLVLEI